MLYSEEDIAILETKQWFYYHEDTATRLQPNVIIEFILDSEYRYLTDTAFSSIVTKGTIAIKSRAGKRVHVGAVDFQWGAAKGNPVIEYLERHKIDTRATLFDDGGYELTALSPEYLTKAIVPSSNHEYARLSFDGNPIHINPYIADMAGLPGMIAHGMWTSASTRAVVEQVAAKDCPERIRMYQTEFTGMVLPNDQLTTTLNHFGMKEGRMLVKGNTSNADGETVMNVLAEVDQPLTAYVFTGQGSQQVGMGMELYQQSSAARAVWDRAENHILATYGLSILDIVRTNPVEHTVNFRGCAGKRILRNYMGCGETFLVPGLTAESSSFMFQAAGGLLNATQFTQVALVTAALAAVADMQMRELVQTHAAFAGHSLGELCALAALTDVFTLNDILDIVFYRGLIMQSAVQRDQNNAINYGMVAVDPSQVPAFDEHQLHLVVDAIGGGGLIQVVNYNVRNHQYVVAGSLANLAVLRLVLDDMAANGRSDEFSVEQMVKQVQVTGETPVRGTATIPLTGINVPFHSRLLLEGAALFRDVLQAKIGHVEPVALEQRYIPNLTGMPFEVSQEYFKLVYDATKSSAIKEALNDWDDALLDIPTERSRLATVLLIELLSYQLASPVQWIKTQDHLFSTAGVQRMVEIGPSPVLCGMAAKTLAAVSKSKKAELLHIETDHDAVYYVQPESKILDNSNAVATVTATRDTETQPKASAKPAINPASSEPLQPSPQQQVVSETNAPIVDQPIPAIDVILAVIAFKAKKPLGEILIQQSIKSLVAGKSTFQNELLGDLQKEFGKKIPDKAEEMSLQELASAIGSFGGSLGKCTQPFVARMFNSKMPGGFSLAQTRSTLQTLYGLGPLRQDALLLVALTMEPAARLTSEAEASAWLDTVAQTYAARVGISYVAASGSTGGAGGKGAVPAISSAEMQKIRQKEVAHIQQQIQVLARYAGIDLLDGTRSADREKAASAELQSELSQVKTELGDELMAGVLPQFDARKARHFDSYWNWARQDAYEWIQQAIAVCSSDTISDEHIDLCNDTRVQRLKNCANAELLELLSGTAKVLRTSNNSTLEPVVQLVNTLYKACQQALGDTPVYCELSTPMQPKTHISAEGDVSYTEIARKDEPTYAAFVERMQLETLNDQVPPIHMSKQTSGGQWMYDQQFTSVYFDGLSDISRQGVSYVGKTALVTGCGRGSIGAEIVRGLLMGGAKVLATTSSYSRKTTLFFEDMYRECGSRGSELIVVPFNQGSVQDIDSLVGYIFGTGAGDLSWNLDYVFPFAAISDIGSMATNLGSHSELAQRIMLTNVMRLLGAIKSAQASLKCPGKPSLVVLPLSPNHGNFGGDGLYGECKIGLETAFNRWKSEGWESYLSIVGAVIGWVRGTGLMSANNTIAQVIEDTDARTFSTRESAFTILGLLCPKIICAADQQPVWANLDGGLGRMQDLGAIGLAERDRIERRSKILSGINFDNSSDIAILLGITMSNTVDAQDRSPLAKPSRYFPTAKGYDYLQHLRHMQGMVNLDKVVVITGFGEVSPQGNAETRWEIEAFGELTMEGCIELAWIMGLIKHHNGPLALTDQQYTGWIDAKSGETVRDIDVKPRYHEHILAHSGIRPIEPELANGFNPEKKAVIQEMLIEHDMEPFEASADEAVAFKQSNGKKVDIWENTSGMWLVRFLKGAVIHVSMSVSAASFAAGLIPTGWSAARFGIPEDIINQVDPITLFTLVAAVEALVRSGITDPYELYQYFHVSEIGNSIGSGVGGMRALHDIFNKRAHNRDIRNDAVQEGLSSTTQAWINMLLISASGPVKPLVGACASAAISIDTAVETIQAGKAKVMLAGSADDFSEESSTEFASIGATSKAQEAIACGRTISEMCRPCTSTRSGFMEGQGSGVVVLMSASAAIACGAPIYGIVGMSGSATDKNTGISPLRGSLAVWGLTADDIGLASFHGTSTQANDKNESEVINAQLKHVGRTPGHVVPAVCQKWLTGHAKGAAASFMVNGVLQSLRTGLVPGNRNADNIAPELKECDYSLYLSRTIQTTGIKAALLKSFGFGQVSGELLIIHPDYLLATLEKEQLEKYNKKLQQRDAKSQRYWQDVLVGNHTFVQAKSHPPYTEQQEQSVYLNPLARAHFDPATKEYKF
ncbi:fatty acid synthase alpha subunit Lsd1 [Coemansia sp. RSA 1972]|nr:fatty acid synthase alpha subunit Lsd1 [Coemansia sp. RSA 1972]